MRLTNAGTATPITLRLRLHSMGAHAAGVIWKQSMSNVLEYLKDRYDEEQDRFAHFEEKCSKLLTLLSILIAALGSIAAVKSPLAFPPTSVLQWLLVVALLGAIFSLICAWGHTLLALKIDDCPVMPRSSETANYLRESTEEVGEQHLFNCYVDTLEKLADAVNRKAKNVELAYSELTIAAWLIGGWAILLIVMESSS